VWCAHEHIRKTMRPPLEPALDITGTSKRQSPVTGVPNFPQFVKAVWYRRGFSPLLIRRVCTCNETGKYTGPRKRTFTVVPGFTRRYWVSSSTCKVFISPSLLSLTCRPQDKKVCFALSHPSSSTPLPTFVCSFAPRSFQTPHSHLQALNC
jgi:hypothetical protein